MTNVKVYISLEEVGAGERMERGMVRGGGGGGEKEKKNRGEGAAEEMPCIPLSAQRKPQREREGEGRKRQKRERNTGNGGGEEKDMGWAGIRPPHVKIDRDGKGGVYKRRNDVLDSSPPPLWS